MAHNAAALVDQYSVKVRSMYDLWVDLREGEDVTLDDLKNVYGAEAYAFNDMICGSLRVCYPIQPIRCCFHLSTFVFTATTISH